MDNEILKSSINNLNRKERDEVSYGKLCPCCKGTNIINIGHNFDGMNANFSFDCLDCPAKWEGY